MDGFTTTDTPQSNCDTSRYDNAISGLDSLMSFMGLSSGPAGSSQQSDDQMADAMISMG